MSKSLTAFLILLLTGCGDTEREPAAPEEAAASAPAVVTDDAVPPSAPAAQPIAPGQPGGLPDDRTPVSETPFTAGSAQGAANVVQTYYAFIESGRYADAWRLWGNPGEAAAATADAFAKRFAGFREYHAQVGAPERIEGAAGSRYVTIPVQAYGVLADGTAFNSLGKVKLRRSNNVPGASAEQRQWRIIGVEPPESNLR